MKNIIIAILIIIILILSGALYNKYNEITQLKIEFIDITVKASKRISEINKETRKLCDARLSMIKECQSKLKDIINEFNGANKTMESCNKSLESCINSYKDSFEMLIECKKNKSSSKMKQKKKLKDENIKLKKRVKYLENVYSSCVETLKVYVL